MKVVKIIIAIFMIIIFAKFVYAERGYTSNASPVTTSVSSANRYRSITFPFTTRDLRIWNGDTKSYIYVDLKNSSNTSDRNSCLLIKPGSLVELKDFATDGISILWSNSNYGSYQEASPITVLATY